MTEPIITPSSGAGRVADISFGVAFGDTLVCAIFVSLCYVCERRARARCEQKTVDIECGSRDGSVVTFDESREEYPTVVKVDIDGRSCSSGITQLGDDHKKSQDDETLHEAPLSFVLQVSEPEAAHLKNSFLNESMDSQRW